MISKLHQKMLNDIDELSKSLDLIPKNLYVSNNCVSGLTTRNELITFYAGSDFKEDNLLIDDVYVMYMHLLKHFNLISELSNANHIYTVYMLAPVYVDSSFNLIINKDYIDIKVKRLFKCTEALFKKSINNSIINYSKDLSLVEDKPKLEKVIAMVRIDMNFTNCSTTIINPFEGGTLYD